MKSIIRKQIIKQRKSLSANDFSQLSLQICQKVTTHRCFKQSKTVASYSSFANEVDLSSLLILSKQWFLPVVKPNNAMCFKLFNKDVKLAKNKYGIEEPLGSEIVNADQIDLCLVPLVGFNRKGHRLGMGAGYYDRYFALNNSNKKPTILAGIAYDFQEHNEIQSDDWDIPLNYVFTNKEVIKI